MAKRQRDRAITLRLTEDELAFFRQQHIKSGIESQSDFMIALLKSKPIVVVEELKTVSAELRRQGTNLNQIARYLNSGGYLDTEITAALTDCRRFYKKLKSMEVK
ncbi:MAG: plasmid mobilization relaxosome protein MobC [Angelakisella sp.]